MRIDSLAKAQPYKVVEGVLQYVMELRCDNISDITPPSPECALGSIAFEINTGKYYGLDISGHVYTWVEQ